MAGCDDAGDGDDVALDLFGRPMRPLRDPRGRPSYRVTEENRLRVMARAAARWSQERIARDLGCDVKTLRKHFSRELEAGADQIEGMALDVVVQKMRAGDNGAIARLFDRLDRAAARARAEARRSPQGKKEMLEEGARKPTGGWDEALNTGPH